MTNRKFGRKWIRQALGLLALGLALLVGSWERVAPAPATWTVDVTFFNRAWAALTKGPKQIQAAGTPVVARETSNNGTSSGLLVVVNEGANTMATIDLATSDIKTVAVGSQPHSGDLTPDGSQAFIGNFGSGDVSVVDIQFEGKTPKLSVVETIKVGRQPTSLDFDPNSNKLYVNNFGDNSVSVIEVKATGGSRVVATITGFRQPIFVRISPDGKRGYVSSQRTGEGVAVFDTATNTIISRIALPNVELRRLALSPDGKRLYVAVRTDILGTGQIAVIDTESLQILQRYRTESFPLEIAVTPNGRCLVITHSVPNRVSLMDVSDGEFLVGQDPEAREPQSVAIIENLAYVTNYLSDTISVFKFGEQCAEKK